MRAVTYKSIIDRISGYLGQDGGMSAEDAGLANRLINTRYRGAFEFYWWPEAMRTERRTFRPVYDSGLGPVYLPGDQVYFRPSSAYYVAVELNISVLPVSAAGVANSNTWAPLLTDYGADTYSPATTYTRGKQIYFPDTAQTYQCYAVSTLGNAPTDTNYWTPLPQFVRSIDYEQEDQTIIGETRFIWDRDPELNNNAVRVPFQVKADYLLVRGTGKEVWVEFRVRPNSFTGANWAQGAYAVGDQVYYDTTGDYYRAIDIVAGEAPTDAAKWEKLEFPYVLAEYVAQSVYAAMVSKEEEMPEDFAVEQTAGFPLLLAELQKIERLQGQTRPLNVVNARSC